MRARILLVLALLPLSAGCAQNPTPAFRAPGQYDGSLRFGGRERSYTLWVPKAAEQSRPIPLVVALHGWSMSGKSFARYSHFDGLYDREGFALVAPDGLGEPRGWNAGFLDLSGEGQDDAQLVANLIDRATREVRVDPKRIYIVGHSNGAMLASLVGARFSTKVAAIGVVSGTIGVPARVGRPLRRIPTPISPLSVMIVHGTNDRLVTYEPDREGLLKGIGAPEAALWWAKADGAREKVRVRTQGKVTKDTWHGRDRTTVQLVSIEGGAHDWPTTQLGFDATAEIWRFFRDHPKR